MKNEKVVSLYSKTQKHKTQQARRKSIKNIDGIKYFNKSQIRLIRRTVRDKAELDMARGKITSIREWLVIDILTSTGVRVSETANLRCGDLKIGYAQSEIFIRNGKGSKSRTIQIPESLKKHLNRFLKWKATQNESVESDAYIFLGQRGPWTSQAIQQIVKKYLKLLDLYESGKSVHALRHSYAVELYRREKDLRAVQKQLGHSSIQTTQIYADVTKEDIQGQIKNIWN